MALEKATLCRWEGSTPPSPPSETQWNTTMGRTSARGESQNMNRNNLTRLPTRDRDQYRWSDYHCAKRLTGGWWYAWCTNVHLTGQHTDRRTTISGDKQIYYYHGGERGDTKDSWAEAEMMLVPNWAFDCSPLLVRSVLCSFDVILLQLKIYSDQLKRTALPNKGVSNNFSRSHFPFLRQTTISGSKQTFHEYEGDRPGDFGTREDVFQTYFLAGQQWIWRV